MMLVFGSIVGWWFHIIGVSGRSIDYRYQVRIWLERRVVLTTSFGLRLRSPFAIPGWKRCINRRILVDTEIRRFTPDKGRECGGQGLTGPAWRLA